MKIYVGESSYGSFREGDFAAISPRKAPHELGVTFEVTEPATLSEWTRVFNHPTGRAHFNAHVRPDGVVTGSKIGRFILDDVCEVG